MLACLFFFLFVTIGAYLTTIQLFLLFLQNSEKVLYPSVTVCLNHEVAIFNREALLDGLDESDNPKLFNLTHTTDMSDVLLSVRQNYGPITNMSCI